MKKRLMVLMLSLASCQSSYKKERPWWETMEPIAKSGQGERKKPSFPLVETIIPPRTPTVKAEPKSLPNLKPSPKTINRPPLPKKVIPKTSERSFILPRSDAKLKIKMLGYMRHEVSGDNLLLEAFEYMDELNQMLYDVEPAE